MTAPVPVLLISSDPISQAGLTAALRSRPELRLVSDHTNESTHGTDGRGAVAIVAVDALDESAWATIRGLRGQGWQRTVLVLNELGDHDLLDAVDAGVCAIVWRWEATATRLAQTVLKAAAGESALPPALLTRLLKQVSRLQRHVLAPRGISFSGLAPREADVLRLVAEGLDTNEVAQKLAYSARTVSNILQAVTNRYQLRNRTHAVAYAIREGLI
ncbi:MAG TPA: response regulator transcription factor [Pseudonocardiaceae bacterium]|jgi:DNA-binding NarL/FixJ family response regulator|nr:response regulator transcription factor [Pseudonocardiaceae bacterium]